MRCTGNLPLLAYLLAVIFQGPANAEFIFIHCPSILSFRAMLDTDLHLGIGADWLTSKEWTLWELIEVGLTRQQVGGVGAAFAGESLTLEELIEGFTVDSAYIFRSEDLKHFFKRVNDSKLMD